MASYKKGDKLIAIRDIQSHYGDKKIKKGETLVFACESTIRGCLNTADHSYPLVDFLPYPERGMRLRTVRDTKSRGGRLSPRAPS